MAKGVWIVAEHRDGALRKVSFELASTARKLADQTGDEVAAVVVGSGVEAMAAELGKYGVDKVFVADNAAFEPYTTDAHAAAVAKAVKDNDPAILLVGASAQGKDLAETRFFLCPVCGHIEMGAPPETCPICGAKREKFTQV